MTNLDKIKEIVNSDNAEDKIVDFFLHVLQLEMDIFDNYVCNQCKHNKEPNCPNHCPYSDEEEIKMWLKAEQ